MKFLTLSDVLFLCLLVLCVWIVCSLIVFLDQTSGSDSFFSLLVCVDFKLNVLAET